MGFWAKFYIVIIVIGLIHALLRHGRTNATSAKDEFLISIFTTVFMLSIFLFEGFFKVFEWPQIVMIAAHIVGLIVDYKRYTNNKVMVVSFPIGGIFVMLNAVVLWYGGFFG